MDEAAPGVLVIWRSAGGILVTVSVSVAELLAELLSENGAGGLTSAVSLIMLLLGVEEATVPVMK